MRNGHHILRRIASHEDVVASHQNITPDQYDLMIIWRQRYDSIGALDLEAVLATRVNSQLLVGHRCECTVHVDPVVCVNCVAIFVCLSTS